MSEPIMLTIDTADQPIPHREAVASKSGNLYWGLLDRKANGERYYNRRGTKVTGLKGLPKSGTILGTKVTFTEGANDKGKPQVKAEAVVIVPGHGKKQFHSIFTDLGDGDFQVTSCVNGIGGGGNGRKASNLDDL